MLKNIITKLKVKPMSIRKRLFISNAAMIATPILFIMVIVILLNVVINDGFNDFHQGWQSSAGPNATTFHNLKKTASLEKEKLLDPAYLQSVTNQLGGGERRILIRKGSQLKYSSDRAQDISSHDLPNFGNEGFNPRNSFGHGQYSLKQYDFYFNDGTEGSIFLVNDSSSFVQFARTFFYQFNPPAYSDKCALVIFYVQGYPQAS